MKGMCRLCGKVKSRFADVLSIEGGSHDLLVKIRAYVNIVVSERDPFPKLVCMLCLGKLDYICQFQDMCRNAQISFRRQKDLEEETDRMTSEVVRQLFTRTEVSSTGHNAYSSKCQDVRDDVCPTFVETSSVNGDMSFDEDDVCESWPKQSDISEPYSSELFQREQIDCQNAMKSLARQAYPFVSNDPGSVISLPNNIHNIESENNNISVNDGSLISTTRSEVPQNNLSKLDMLPSSPPLNEVRQTNLLSSQNSESCNNMIAKAHLKSWLMAKSSQTPVVSFPTKPFTPEPSTLPTSVLYPAAANPKLIQNGSSSQAPDVCTVVVSAEVPSWHGLASSSIPRTPVSTWGLPTILQHDSSLQLTSTADPSFRLNCNFKSIPSAYPIESLPWQTSFSSQNVPNPVNCVPSIFTVPSSESSASCVSSISKLTLPSSKTAQQDSITLSASVNQFSFVRKGHGASTLESDHIVGESNAHTMMNSQDASIPVQTVPSTANFVVSPTSDVAIAAQSGTTISEDNGGNDDAALNDNGIQTHSQSGLIRACRPTHLVDSDVNPTSKTASAIESNDQYFEDRACGWKKYTVEDLFKSRSNEQGRYPRTVPLYSGIIPHLSKPSSTQLHKLPKCCLSCNASATGSFRCCSSLFTRTYLAFYCNSCNQIFVKVRDWLSRLSECSKCDQKFRSSTLLWQHNQKVHVKNSFSCNDCGKTFDIKGNLIKHINCTHLNVRNHKCSKCDKTFRRRRTLKDHMDRHTGTPSYVCPTCGLTFYTHSSLASHKRMIHEAERPHKCNECDSAFKSKQQLTLHQLVHTGEKPFCCDQCGKSFARSFTLDIHIKCVHMPKSITCPLCPNMFSHKSNLKTHLEYHAKLKYNKYK